jgi:hypothetical protein
MLYNSLQRIDNHAIANSFILHFTIIYLDVRSLIMGDLLENLYSKNQTLLIYLKKQINF